MDLGSDFQKTNFRIRFINQRLQDLGLQFGKTNIKIRINIFEILCVCAGVPISSKTNNFDFFSPNLPQNGFRIDNSEN